MRRYATIFERIKRLMVAPTKEWRIIIGENRNVSEIFVSYLLPLSILTIIACYIGYGIVGSKQDMFGLVASSKLGYRYAIYYTLLINGSIFISTGIISFIAHFFQANARYAKNFTLVVYSYTPIIVATILLIIPAVSFLVYLAGLYSILLLYTGISKMTDISKDMKMKYYAAIVATLFFIFLGLSKILERIILD